MVFIYIPSRCNIKPIFHWKLSLRWLAMKWTQTSLNLHDQRQPLALGTQRHLYSTCSRWSWRCMGNANFSVRVGGYANFSIFTYQHVGIPDAKLWHWGSKPTRGPNANGFASQWNIGLRVNDFRREILYHFLWCICCLHNHSPAKWCIDLKERYHDDVGKFR